MKSALYLQSAFLSCAFASPPALNIIASNQSQETPASSLSRNISSLYPVANFDPCTGPQSGIGLTKESCQDTMARGLPDKTSIMKLNYGDRSVGNFDVNLPQRFIGCEWALSNIERLKPCLHSIVDGRCIVDLTIKDIHQPASVSWLETTVAALLPISRCVIGMNPPEGGVVDGFGKSFRPTVKNHN